ncbi:MAG: hypothetical protein QOE55_6793 [Acidobacteriaceae bacterium]|jgi:hypothetical protein|nr:hypothetical protein [Acidobacteriaceae bacterium]
MRRARISITRSFFSSCRVSHGLVSSRRRSKRVGYFSRKGALLLCRGVPGLARRCNDAAEESVNDGACVKQVLQGSERCRRLCRKRFRRLCCRPQVSPGRRDHGLAAIGQDQNQHQSALSVCRPKNVERFTFKRMPSADNCNSLGKVLLMGSV